MTLLLTFIGGFFLLTLVFFLETVLVCFYSFEDALRCLLLVVVGVPAIAWSFDYFLLVFVITIPVCEVFADVEFFLLSVAVPDFLRFVVVELEEAGDFISCFFICYRASKSKSRSST